MEHLHEFICPNVAAYPFRLTIGAAMTLQTAINTQVSQILASSLQAAFLSFSIGTVLLALLVLWARQPLPQLAQLFNLPWYSYCAGMLGVYAISISIYTAPKLGFLTFSGLVIFGQLLTSMLFDHFGWLGAEKIQSIGNVYWVAWSYLSVCCSPYNAR